MPLLKISSDSNRICGTSEGPHAASGAEVPALHGNGTFSEVLDKTRHKTGKSPKGIHFWTQQTGVVHGYV